MCFEGGCVFVVHGFGAGRLSTGSLLTCCSRREDILESVVSRLCDGSRNFIVARNMRTHIIGKRRRLGAAGYCGDGVPIIEDSSAH